MFGDDSMAAASSNNTEERNEEAASDNDIGYECSIEQFDTVMRQQRSSNNSASGNNGSGSSYRSSTPLGRVAYAMKRVISREEDSSPTTTTKQAKDDWGEAVTNQEINRLISSSPYNLRKFKSTPLQGLEKGYIPTKRTISYDNKRHSRLDEEEEESLLGTTTTTRATSYDLIRSKSFRKKIGRRNKNMNKKSRGEGTKINQHNASEDNTSVDSSLINGSSDQHLEEGVTTTFFSSKTKMILVVMSICAVVVSMMAYVFSTKDKDKPVASSDSSSAAAIIKISSSTSSMAIDEQKQMRNGLITSSPAPSIVSSYPSASNNNNDSNVPPPQLTTYYPTLMPVKEVEYTPFPTVQEVPAPASDPVPETNDTSPVDEPVAPSSSPLPTPGNGCEDADSKWFKIELNTDSAANETSWELEIYIADQWRPFSMSKPHDNNQKYTIKFCIPVGQYRFTIRDEGSDGLCCDKGYGSYSGYLRGSKIFESPGEEDYDVDWSERIHTFVLEGSGGDNTTTTTSPTSNSTASTISPTTSMKPQSTLDPTPPATSSPVVPTLPPTMESILDGEETDEPTTSSPTREPTYEPTGEEGTDEPTNPPSHLPSPYPTNPPSPRPSPPPTPNPTNPPSPSPSPPPTDPLPTEDTITKFFVIADCPYDYNERYNLMPKHISELESDGEFLVHLGDLMYAMQDRCGEQYYAIASEILQKAKMPTLVLPGDNDINDCPSIDHGEAMWMKYFHKFDEKWDHSLPLTRWGKLDESFGMLRKGVLYIGLNMVGGTPYSYSEKVERHELHLQMVKALFEEHKGKFKVIVLLKHADPGRNHQDFFNGEGRFIDLIARMGIPTIHFHGDNHYYFEKEEEYGVDNYVRISLVGESQGPPLSVTIDVSKKNPIRVNRRNGQSVECCSEGWPRNR